MKLRDKKTGEIDEYLFSNKRGDANSVGLNKGDDINDPIFFGSLAELCERFEDAPEEPKPFEEVAKVGYVLKIGAGQVDWIADENSVDTLKVADRDYYEILPDGTKKTEFTWDEAMEIEKKTHGKWRAPTVPEWFAICAAFGRSEDGADVDPQVLHEKLNLIVNEEGDGYYWSAASYSTTNSYGLVFYSSYLNPRNSYGKGYGFAVRCVAGEGE